MKTVPVKAVALFAHLSAPSPNIVTTLLEMPGFQNNDFSRDKKRICTEPGYIRQRKATLAWWMFRDLEMEVYCTGDSGFVQFEIIREFQGLLESSQLGNYLQSRMIVALKTFIQRTGFRLLYLPEDDPFLFSADWDFHWHHGSSSKNRTWRQNFLSPKLSFEVVAILQDAKVD